MADPISTSIVLGFVGSAVAKLLIEFFKRRLKDRLKAIPRAVLYVVTAIVVAVGFIVYVLINPNETVSIFVFARALLILCVTLWIGAAVTVYSTIKALY